MAALVAALIVHLFGPGHGDAAHRGDHAAPAEIASSIAASAELHVVDHRTTPGVVEPTGGTHDEGPCGDLRPAVHGAATLSTGTTCGLRIAMEWPTAASPTAVAVLGRPLHAVRDLGVQRI